jgi:hypothetical protein
MASINHSYIDDITVWCGQRLRCPPYPRGVLLSSISCFSCRHGQNWMPWRVSLVSVRLRLGLGIWHAREPAAYDVKEKWIGRVIELSSGGERERERKAERAAMAGRNCSLPRPHPLQPPAKGSNF